MKRIKPFDNSQQDTDVDVSGWPPGIYIAVVYSDGSARGKVKFCGEVSAWRVAHSAKRRKDQEYIK